MAVAHRHADTDLASAALARSEFFQTVRLILSVSRAGIGGDTRAADEAVRFRAADGMRHPDTEIAAIDHPANDCPVSLQIGFMGLTGPMGVMPDHYSDLVVERRRARDEGLGRFLDLFNHRTISLFYRAWAKYRLPVRFGEERGTLADPFSRALAAVAGIARLDDDPTPLAAAGPLARRVRSAGALRRIVGATFAMPIEVIELRPRWIHIDEREQTRLGGARSAGAYAQLGSSAVAGASACDVGGRFRLRIGPLSLMDFEAFFTADGIRRRMIETVRFAVGATIDFDLQLVLRADAVPSTRIGGGTALGHNSWLLAGPAAKDRADAVLSSRVGGKA